MPQKNKSSEYNVTLYLQIPLYGVQTHCNLLGVDTTTNEEEDS